MIVIDKTIKILKATLLWHYKCFSGFNRKLAVKTLRKNFRLFASCIYINVQFIESSGKKSKSWKMNNIYN